MIDLENKVGVLDLDFSNNELFKIEAYTEKLKSTINSNVVNSDIKVIYTPTDQFIIDRKNIIISKYTTGMGGFFIALCIIKFIMML